MGTDLLGIYLQDHMAGSVMGVELAKRAAGNNEGTKLGASLERIATEIEEDRDSLARVMEELGAGPDRLKNAGAWTLEKAGRLKPNGRLLSYSPLSRLIELEGLELGITGKLALWRALDATIGPSVAGENFATLAERAESQRQALEPFRLEATREAFADARATADSSA